MNMENYHPDTIKAIEEDEDGHGCKFAPNCGEADRGCKIEGCYSPVLIKGTE